MSEATIPSGETIKRFAIEDYLSILRYRKWLLLLPMLTLSLVTAIGSHFMKDIFRAQTTIEVNTAGIEDTFITATVKDDLEEKVTTTRAFILSDSSLDETIKKFLLYGYNENEPEENSKIQEDRRKWLRDDIDIEIREKKLILISFTGPDQEKVEAVTNHLADTFIQQALERRTEMASGVTEMLADEVKRVERELEEQEKKIAAFRSQHTGALPDQMDANQRSLDRLNDRLVSIDEQVARAQDRKVVLETEIAKNKGSALLSGGRIGTMQEQLDQKRAELKSLLQTYTDSHPDVIELQTQIEKLQNQISSVQSQDEGVSSANQSLYNQLQRENLEIKSLQGQRAGVMAERDRLSSKLDLAPDVDQELKTLERERDKLEKQHQEFAEKLTKAEQSRVAQDKEKQQQFNIIDRAQYPQRPYKPNRPRLVALAFTLGLIIGLIAIFIAEHMDHSFRDDEDLMNFSGLPVLTTVPRFTLEMDQLRKTNIIKLSLVIVGLIGLVVLMYLILLLGFNINLIKVFAG